jgi:hypothetical protein
LALAVPLSRFTSRVGGGSAFFVRPHYTIMKRDMELIRLLLIQQETGESPSELESYPVDAQIYNLELMHDAGFIVANFMRDATGEAKGATIRRLTWSGHDFLDSTSDSEIWKLAKEHVIKPGASWTFSLLVEWLKQQAHHKVFGVPDSS